MYPQIPWGLVADPFGSAEHILGNTCLKSSLCNLAVSALMNVALVIVG